MISKDIGITEKEELDALTLRVSEVKKYNRRPDPKCMDCYTLGFRDGLRSSLRHLKHKFPGLSSDFDEEFSNIAQMIF
jgi:hypothetical protein